ncbi:MAG: hypothetical protein WCY84_03885, partial [Candidatus Cloacimonadaceae bacterium]
YPTANHYGLNINLLRCALRARFIKSGRKTLRPYILVSLDIVLGFGISGQLLRSAAKHGILCSSLPLCLPRNALASTQKKPVEVRALRGRLTGRLAPTYFIRKKKPQQLPGLIFIGLFVYLLRIAASEAITL